MSGDEPGFLGLGGRLGSAAGEELVAAGFATEMADAHLLHDGFGLADLAHVLALDDLGRASSPTTRPTATPGTPGNASSKPWAAPGPGG